MRRLKNIIDLTTVGSLPAKLVNIITLFRIMMFPVLIACLFLDQIDVYKWLLIMSFLTDLIDGQLARRYKVTSVMGARIDSVGDDLTMLAAIIGAFYYRFDFILKESYFIFPLIALYILQLILAVIKYGKMTSFHTILAKVAAFFQGLFLCSLFFFQEISYPLFYPAFIFTALDVIEEITLVIILKNWEVNIKGVYWVLRRSKKNHQETGQGDK